jgi:CheY-like chemotaxis protein
MSIPMMNQLSVLIADDHPVIREAASQILEEAGHNVHTASDGAEALRKLSGAWFDVLVTDVLMPGMDGIQLIGEVRRRHPGVRIMAMSGGCDGFSREDFLTIASRLGAGAVLEKPFMPDELIERLAYLCPMQAAAM